jgi:hypothetical protein
MTQQARMLFWIRWGALLLGAVLIAARVASHGLDLFILVSTALLAIVALALQYTERRTQRPLKTYLRWGLASFTLGLVLVVLPLLLAADIRIGLILWLGLAAAGLVWAIHYERSEPR